jgi:hypothetical protein
MNTLKSLETERTKLLAEQKQYDFEEPEHKAKFSRICEISNEITAIHNQRHIETLRSGLAPLYKFIHNGFLEENFTPSVYRLISQTFGNIAHTDRERFYHVMFASNDLVIQSLEMMLGFESKGNDWNTKKDLENEVKEMIEESKVLQRLKNEKVRDTILREKAELRRLEEKYGHTE